MQSDYDLAILGGGLAGLTLAKQLLERRPEVRTVLIERHEHPANEGAFKVGESTIEIGAYYLAEEVGLKKHLLNDQLPKFGLRFFFSNGEPTLDGGLEVGLSDFFPAPGYQVDRGRLENCLGESVVQLGASFAQRATIQRVELAEGDEPHYVDYLQDGQHRRIATRWVVDASGRMGLLKRQLGLKESIPHRVNAAWFRIGAPLRIDEWCDEPAWRSRAGKVARRWLSTNHLLGRGYWVWIIPLASGATSLGIVADPRLHPLSDFNRFDKALTWLDRHEPCCAEAVRQHADKLQDFRALKQLGHSSREVFSPRRWALTGEAGVFLDPLYSPGIDYIALANTMIRTLIEQDLDGAAIGLLASRFQGIFLTLFRDNQQTYQDQYPLFGNARVMSLKYVWDYAIYWSFPALLYLHGKLTDPRFFGEMSAGIEELRRLNREMQQFFRDWDAADGGGDVPAVFVNQNEIGILKQLNGELRDRLDDSALRVRFARNVGILQSLAAEIRARVGRLQPQLSDNDNASLSLGVEDRLDGLFAALGI